MSFRRRLAERPDNSPGVGQSIRAMTSALEMEDEALRHRAHAVRPSKIGGADIVSLVAQ
jgi:hypothetical protein